MLLLAVSAEASDFGSPVVPRAWASPLEFIESGLSAPPPGLCLAGSLLGWIGLPEVVTRAIALGAGWRSMNFAAGLSQTGDPEIGWTALGCALGASDTRTGAALRGVGRRDRHPDPGSGRLGPGIGVEVGGGAWFAPFAGASVWASAPEVWSRGAAPPLRRSLELGGKIESGEAAIWLSRVATREHRLGLSLGRGAAVIWAEARDHPLRAGLGISVAWACSRVAALVESHPVLGERVRVSVGFATPPAKSRK